ncbi:MAG: hypothetical protein M3T56_01970 [Chloroflexota bacterium]|nr:hypothetical protein [Chloroflexota bacterium]
MDRRTFASIAAFVSLVNGIPGLIAPAAAASLYGVTLQREGVLSAQLLAGSYIGYAIINWATRGISDSAVLRGLDAGNLVGWAVSVVIWTYAGASGLTNATAWFGVGLMVLFTVGWAYFVFADSRTGSRAITATAPR